MFYPPMYQIWLLLLLGGLRGVQRVSGIVIYTPNEVEAANGTNVKLKCTFTTTQPVSLQSVTVSWNFRPINAASDESVFYYQEVPYPPQQGRFKGHAVWSGDVLRKDASITLHEVPPTFNGTFICQVRNRPDVHGSNGEIVFRVVNKVSLSEIGMLAAGVGGACAVILIILGIFMAVRFCRKKRMENDIEMHPQEQEREREWKDPTVCSPEEAVHLTVLTKEKEAESSDDEESEPSSGDDEEEDGLEEDDDDDDDDDEDDDDDDDDGGDEDGGIMDALG